MSHQALSADTEVVLLLCGRFGGERQDPYQPLSAREYGEFAKWLKVCNLRPADLMTDAGRGHLQAVHEAKLERTRIDFLLRRGTAMALSLQRWSHGGLWVISRGDAEFPKRLKRHLKHAAPPLLYGAGNKALLDTGGLAIIGSREATEGALEFTRAVAANCASAGVGVVSGGARGVDAAAMQGSSEVGGHTIGVLANDLLKTSVNRQNRLGIQRGHLVLVSPFYPEAGFNAGNAMGRNKYIYALADKALVIDSALGSGGTWEGALEALNQQWVPLYVRMPGNGQGNAALIDKGGIPFTYVPGQGEKLIDFFARTTPNLNEAFDPASPQQFLLSSPESDSEGDVSNAVVTSVVQDESSDGPLVAKLTEPFTLPTDMATELLNDGSDEASVPASTSAAPASLDMYVDFLAKLALALLAGPLSEKEVSERLGLENGQAKAWLKKAVESGKVEKLKKPVRYVQGLQASLLD